MKMQVQIVVLPSENQIETMNKGALHEAYGLCQKSLDIEALKMQTLEAEIQKARVIDEERYEQIAENIELICSVQSMISDEIYYRRKYELYGYV